MARLRRVGLGTMIGAALALSGCQGEKPAFMSDPMAPPGSTPDQVRAFCTGVADQAANWLQNSEDPIGSRLRASNEAFAACMARHNVRP